MLPNGLRQWLKRNLKRRVRTPKPTLEVHVLLVELSLNALQGRGRLHLPVGKDQVVCTFALATRLLQLFGVEHAQHNNDHSRFRRAAFHSQLKFKVGNIFTKATA